MDNPDFQEAIARDAEARRIALAILGLKSGASAEEIKKGFRRETRRRHPDANPGDPDANRRLRAILCAYRFLTSGELSDELRETEGPPKVNLHDDRRELSSDWGMFLWWRDKFF